MVVSGLEMAEMMLFGVDVVGGKDGCRCCRDVNRRLIAGGVWMKKKQPDVAAWHPADQQTVFCIVHKKVNESLSGKSAPAPGW